MKLQLLYLAAKYILHEDDTATAVELLNIIAELLPSW